MPFEQLDSLYLYFINVFKRYLTDVAVAALVPLNGTPLLTTYLKVWDDYATFVGFLKRIYSTLDSHQSTQGLKPLSGVALELFN